MTVLAVPIDVTEQVIAEVGPHVRADALLMDVTSVKAAPVAAMLEHSRGSVVGTHPMFGPGVHTLQGQRVVVCRGRGDAWADWVSQQFSARGLTVAEATADQHDAAMSVVQVLTHFQTQVLGLTLARLGIPCPRRAPYTSPAYLLELYVAARHFAQSPALYGPIEMRNPRTAAVTAAFGQATQRTHAHSRRRRSGALRGDVRRSARLLRRVHGRGTGAVALPDRPDRGAGIAAHGACGLHQ